MKGICHLLAPLPSSPSPQVLQGDFLIAVDGGYQRAITEGLSPHLILGDFDSLGYRPTGENVLALPCVKDHTDMAYGVKLGEEKGYTHFLLHGGMGGRLDHTMGNIQLLHHLSHRGRGILLGDGQSATVLTQGAISFPAHFSGYCSLFALLGEAKVSLNHLAYQGNSLTLSPTVPLGVSNEFIQGKSGEVVVEEGLVLMIWQQATTAEEYRELLLF